jgi:catechol 2,3-dioxygenase-like lactoylglutathione lyase family enzyme
LHPNCGAGVLSFSEENYADTNCWASSRHCHRKRSADEFGLLRLRFVKRTVNFDDPGTDHFYFGDDAKSPTTGEALKVPAWLEPRRAELELQLAPLELHKVVTA